MSSIVRSIKNNKLVNSNIVLLQNGSSKRFSFNCSFAKESRKFSIPKVVIFTTSLFLGVMIYTYEKRQGVKSIESCLNGTSLYDLVRCDSFDDNLLSQKELMNELNKRLKAIRQRLSKQGKPTPEILVVALSNNVTEIRFELDSNINIAELLKEWITVVMNKSKSNKTNGSTRDIKNKNTDSLFPPVFRFQNGNLTILSHDRNCKLLWYNDAQGHIASIQKYRGFTLHDIEHITKGYEDVLLSYFLLHESTTSDNTTKGYFDHETDDRFSGSNSAVINNDPLMRALFDKLFGGMSFDTGRNQISSNEFYNQNNDSDNAYTKDGNIQTYPNPNQIASPRSSNNPIDKLRSLGIQVISPTHTQDNINNNINNNQDKNQSSSSSLTWDHLAGYDDIKRQIEDTVINSFLHADIYDQVAKTTRLDFESNRPTALLLTGPPGVGKTLTARILAAKCNRPLVVLKLENIMSKWYGESEKKLNEIFDICEKEMSEDGVIIFIDEIDALAGSRDKGDMHEATRRCLSVILQKVEGFQGKCNSLIICATNRPQDLDAALLSRFDLMIKYDMPDTKTRMAIIQRYAKQFIGNTTALQQLGEISNRLSCRDIKECCEDVERKWASKIIKKEVKNKDFVPPLSEYISSFRTRLSTINQYNTLISSNRDDYVDSDNLKV